jgi:BMFP domain-containing protein YqiC
MAALQEEVAAEAREREALAAKISAMESKVLHGGVNLLDKVGRPGDAGAQG